MPTDSFRCANSNERITMTRGSLVELPPPLPLPPGITVRPLLGAVEAPVWAAIQRDAEPFLTIGDDLFLREFGADDAEIISRCFVAVDTATGEAVGASSAWHGGDPGARGRDWGRLHWVAVRPGFQRRGIARALVVECLYRMAALGHERAYLVTSAGRQGAIALYQDLGFTPDTLPRHYHRAHPCDHVDPDWMAPKPRVTKWGRGCQKVRVRRRVASAAASAMNQVSH